MAPYSENYNGAKNVDKKLLGHTRLIVHINKFFKNMVETIYYIIKYLEEKILVK